MMTASGGLLGLRLTSALTAERDPAEIADQTDERAALRTGVAFGGPLFPAAGTTGHGIEFVEFSHRDAQEVML
jgi:hypothetical protein